MSTDGSGLYWDEDAQEWVSGQAAAPPPPPAVPPLLPPPPSSPPPGEPLPLYELPTATAGPETYGGELPPAPSPNRMPLIAAIAVLVCAGLAAGGWLLFGSGDEKKDDAKPKPSASSVPLEDESPSETPSDTASPTEPSESASPSPSEAPLGYETAAEAEFSVAYQEGWSPRQDSGQNGQPIYFYEEQGGNESYMQVFEVTEDTTPRGALLIAEADLEKRLDGYERNDLAEAGDSAVLDYSYDSEEHGERRRVTDQVFRTETGQLYAILVHGPADGWPEQREVLSVVQPTFTLGGPCEGLDCD